MLRREVKVGDKVWIGTDKNRKLYEVVGFFKDNQTMPWCRHVDERGRETTTMFIQKFYDGTLNQHAAHEEDERHP